MRALVSVGLVVVVSGSVSGCVAAVDEGPLDARGPLAVAFDDAAAQTGVPRDLLVAVAWAQTRFQPPPPVADREHAPPRGGLMGLPAGEELPAAGTAAEIARAADLLARDGTSGGDLEGWRPALSRYAGDDEIAGDLFAQAVLDAVAAGVRGVAFTGETLVIEGTGKRAGAKVRALAAGTDSALAARFVPAREGFFTPGRSQPIDRIVIHTTEGSYDGAIGWFRNPANPWQTSAHYVIRSSDGEITQMVRERDMAHHVYTWNPRSIGIEHEAVSASPVWFTDAMMRSSARLVRDLCDRYGIPMDRQHIVGHVEVPGNDHTDPGAYWDWDYFMALVRDPASAGPPPPVVDPCAGLDFHGTCDGATLRWCDAGAPRSANCAASGRVCGWQDDSTGNNCLTAPPAPPPPLQSDPCGGLDFAGRCDGDTLRWCEAGHVQSADCAAGGRVCAWQDDATGNNCVAAPPAPPPPAPADPCGGLDYAGRCDGATLSWCEDGAVRTKTCGGGLVCGWQDDATGNNCVAAPPADPCSGVTYQGRCDGNTLVWCEASALRTAQCGVCGWQNDSVGNNCL